MKKLFVLTCLTITFCVGAIVSINVNTAYAETEYLRIITEDTPFYKNAYDTEPLFFLPYTYYVRVLDRDQAYTHVECKADSNIPAIDGYVPTEMLFDDGLSVIEPYVNLKVKTLSTALLFEDSSLISPLQYVFAEREMVYYGNYVLQNGSIIYYVSYNNRLGYVKESDVYPFAINNHPNELTFLQPEAPSPQPEQPQTQSKSEMLSLKIIIIGCLVFAGIIGLIFAVKHKPTKSPAVTFYDENDYE